MSDRQLWLKYIDGQFINHYKYFLMLSLLMKGKDKAVPLQAWSGPEGSRKLRFPDFMTTAQDGGKVISLTHRPPSFPGNTPGTHFYSRLSRSQGHSATGRIMSLKNSNDTIGNRTRNLPVCSVVP
jgi:hypothetical protein